MESVNPETTTIQIQNSEDFKNLDLTKFSSKQIFGYNCTVCGKYYERRLYRLQQFDFELLCKNCSSKKYRKPWSEEKKKIVQEKRRQTYLERYGVEHPWKSEKVQEKRKQTNLKRYGVENPLQSEDVQAKIKQTNLSRYGVEHNWQVKKVREKIKHTNLERYGVEHALQSAEIQEKIKHTNLERYGVENPWSSTKVQEKVKRTNLAKYGVEHPWKSEKVQEKIKQTNLERYGVINPFQSEKIQAKIKQTSFERYGVNHPAQSEKIQEKIKQTNLSRYGVEHNWQSEEIREKIKHTNLERYDVEYYSQSKEMQSKRKQTYRYGDTSFDSKPELAFYVYCKEHGTEIQRNTQEFLYEFEGKTHRYFPDFVVNGELVEIKGDQFLNEATGTWRNPFNHSQDTRYEAKHQCAIQNKVKILYSKDYQKCIDYVLEKYGKNFFENCKAT